MEVASVMGNWVVNAALKEAGVVALGNRLHRSDDPLITHGLAYQKSFKSAIKEIYSE